MIGNLMLALGISICAGAGIMKQDDISKANVKRAVDVSSVGYTAYPFDDVDEGGVYYNLNTNNWIKTIESSLLEFDEENMPVNNTIIYSNLFFNTQSDYRYGNYPNINTAMNTWFSPNSYSYSHENPIYFCSVLHWRDAFVANTHHYYLERDIRFAFYKEIANFNSELLVSDIVGLSFGINNPVFDTDYDHIELLYNGGTEYQLNYLSSILPFVGLPIEYVKVQSDAVSSSNNINYYISPYTLHFSFNMPTYNTNVPSYSITGTSYYNVSKTDGYAIGYSDGLEDGYLNGYSDAMSFLNNGNGTALGLFGAIADTPIRFLKEMFSFELFGMNMAAIILSCLSAVVVFGLIKKIWK